MRLFCRGNHWSVVKKQLILDTPTKKDKATSLRLLANIEARVRLEIYDEICAINLTVNKKTIVKNGIENVALQVQDICAQIALGDRK